MRGVAFCPAHITGFFKAEMDTADALRAGSMGAGFSIAHGVRTVVEAEPSAAPKSDIHTSGHSPADTAVSKAVIARYEALLERPHSIRVHHEIGVPVGYGLGSSAAVALSLSLALNAALETGLSRQRAAQVAHTAEIECRTGLGDVAGALDGGFEIRTTAGAPGVGIVERTPSDSRVALVCFAPMSTHDFITDRIESINGLGGRMVEELRSSRDSRAFQDMSARFAGYINVITPRMRDVMEALRDAGIACGVALFGETVFAMVDSGSESRALRILGSRGGQVLRSSVDNAGARLE